MLSYEDGRIRKLDESLRAAGATQPAIERIMEGGELIRKDASPAHRAEWLCGAMERMNEMLDPATRQAMMDEHIRVGTQFPSVKLNTT